MTAYAIAIIRSTRFGPQIEAYLQQIDATLTPFAGKFIIHGGHNTVLEGNDPGQVVAIAFPSIQHARHWYASAAYESIKPLRTTHTEGDLFLLQGVDGDHKASDILART